MTRKQFNNVLIAGNGAGKTSLQISIALAYLKANPKKRNLWILPDDGEEKLWNVEEISLEQLGTFMGIKKIIIDSISDFEYLTDFYKPYIDPVTNQRVVRRFDGLMCCDDLGTIMNRRPEAILSLFRRRRQPNIDFLWSFHGLRTEVPPSFYTYVNTIILGRTSDNHEETMKQLPRDKQTLFEQKYFEVQRITENDPHYFTEIDINPLNM